MRTADFDFHLPPERIALRPARPRDAARLLVVRPDSLADHVVTDLPALLRTGDTLVVNDTRVLPVQLSATHGAARIGVTLIAPAGPARWWSYTRNARRLEPGDRLDFGHGLAGTLEAKRPTDGALLWTLASDEPLDQALARAGAMPLPPYIARRRAADAADATDYQTVYAAHAGSVAAPTAGLHFTPALLAALTDAGVRVETLTLHVGPGTFLPVAAPDPADHLMHPEYGSLDAATADRLNAARATGRVIAVGTTSLRLLESATDAAGRIHPFAGDTAIFITPGHRFRAVDGLITNFHLPRSTLFMLVCALMGVETMRAAYAHAIARDYRFYSYGDASLLVP